MRTVIWDNCSDYEKQELEKIQIEAARIATGASKLISNRNLYNEIGWETLEKRRKNHKLILFYKLYNNLTPDYLSSLVPSSVNEVSHYNLRNANDVQTINARTALYFNSFLPSVIRERNNIPDTDKYVDSVDSFERQCSCRSGDAENAEHFFLSCNFYRDHRIELFRIVTQYCIASLHVVLHGDESLPCETKSSHLWSCLQVHTG